MTTEERIPGMDENSQNTRQTGSVHLPAPVDEPRHPVWRRWEKALGPVFGGLVLDISDFATMGPVGLYFGLLVGGTVAWWICSIYRLPVKKRILWAILAGLYCTTPGTGLLPIATLIGAYVRYRNAETRDKQP